jgi:hypothetical protein
MMFNQSTSVPTLPSINTTSANFREFKNTRSSSSHVGKSIKGPPPHDDLIFFFGTFRQVCNFLYFIFSISITEAEERASNNPRLGAMVHSTQHNNFQTQSSSQQQAATGYKVKGRKIIDSQN